MGELGGKEAVVKRAAPVLLRMVRNYEDRLAACAGERPVVDEPGDLSGDAA